jgi:hypothetical protein
MTTSDRKALVKGQLTDETAIRAALREQGIVGLQRQAGYLPGCIPQSTAESLAALEAHILNATANNNHILAAAYFDHALVRELLLRGDYLALRSFDGW